jgi:hypothetical protein
MVMGVVVCATLPAASVTMMVAVLVPVGRPEPSTTKSPSASGATVVRVAPPSKLISVLTMSASRPAMLKLMEAAPVWLSGSPGPERKRLPSASAVVSGGSPTGAISMLSRLGPAVAPAGMAKERVLVPAWRVTVWVRMPQTSKPSAAVAPVFGKGTVVGLALLRRWRAPGARR